MDAEISTPTLGAILRSYPFRLGLYALATLVIFQAVFWAIKTYGGESLSIENGPIEMAQVFLALVAATGLFYAACHAVVGRAGLVVCGAIVTYAAARESDLLMETLLFDDAYKYLVGIPMLILCGWIVVKERQNLIGETMWLMRQPAATLFGIAGIYLCFVCQSFDRPDMWGAITNGAEVEATKAMVEEYAELFAYLLLAFSGFEASILVRQMRASEEAASLETDEAYPRIAA
jgi:hypothetical protein